MRLWNVYSAMSTLYHLYPSIWDSKKAYKDAQEKVVVVMLSVITFPHSLTSSLILLLMICLNTKRMICNAMTSTQNSGQTALLSELDAKRILKLSFVK